MRRTALLAATFAAVLASGCTVFSERFHEPGRDPLLTALGAEWDTAPKIWPSARMPELRARRTELIPDRAPPPGAPPIGWPPL